MLIKHFIELLSKLCTLGSSFPYQILVLKDRYGSYTRRKQEDMKELYLYFPKIRELLILLKRDIKISSKI